MNDSPLVRYFQFIDRGESRAALALMSEELVFCLARPDGQVEGSSRADLERFIQVRPARAHRLLRVSHAGDTEFALGQSIDVDGDTVLGAFITAMHVGPDGRIDRYLASFYPDLDISLLA